MLEKLGGGGAVVAVGAIGVMGAWAVGLATISGVWCDWVLEYKNWWACLYYITPAQLRPRPPTRPVGSAPRHQHHSHASTGQPAPLATV